VSHLHRLFAGFSGGISTEEIPEAISGADVLVQLNTDFSLKGMTSQELQAIVAAWQSGAISRDTMFELFRRGEILPDGRTNQDEASLVQAGLANRSAGPVDNTTTTQV
jgi:hypothetical protein